MMEVVVSAHLNDEGEGSAELNDEVEGSAELKDEGEDDKRQGVW